MYADYDDMADVLYLALGQPRPGYSEEQDGGLLFRFAYDTNAPCGVTIFDFRENWKDRTDTLAKRVAAFLAARPDEVKQAISSAVRH